MMIVYRSLFKNKNCSQNKCDRWSSTIWIVKDKISDIFEADSTQQPSDLYYLIAFTRFDFQTQFQVHTILDIKKKHRKTNNFSLSRWIMWISSFLLNARLFN